MGRRPSRDERALWRAATRDAVPLAESNAAAPPPATVEAKPKPTRPTRPAPRAAVTPAAPALPPLSHDASPGLDRRNAERLKRGQRPIDARLDLHGLIQDEAHRALDRFLAGAQDREQRCVLVITGKSGVLRAAVPRWLNEAPNRKRLLAFTAAQPKDGGAGALYVLLRRRRAAKP